MDVPKIIRRLFGLNKLATDQAGTYEGDEKALRFLRDLRDKAVHSGGASGFTMQLFHVTLDNPPEPEEDRKARQDELERTWLRGEKP